MSTIRPIKGLGNDAHKIRRAARRHGTKGCFLISHTLPFSVSLLPMSLVACCLVPSAFCLLSAVCCLPPGEVKGSKVLTRNYLSTCGIGLSRDGGQQGRARLRGARVGNIILSDFMMNLCPKIPAHLHTHTRTHTHHQQHHQLCGFSPGKG